MASRARSADGYVTIAVLVFVGIFAAVVSSTLAASRPTLGLMRLGAQELASDGLLDGGLAAAGYWLFVAKRDAAAFDDRVLRMGEGAVSVSISDEAARVDINAAEADLLAGLYAAIGGRSMTPADFAARVIDWRDADGEQASGGAEVGLYAAAGAPYGPRNGPFRSTADLGFVLGVRSDDLARLMPLTTVFNPAGGIDPLGASRAVLSALPDLTPSDFALLLQARSAGVADRSAVLASLSSPSRFFLGEGSGVYRVRVMSRLAGGLTRSAEGVLVGPPGPAKDYGVVYWSRNGS